MTWVSRETLGNTIVKIKQVEWRTSSRTETSSQLHTASALPVHFGKVRRTSDTKVVDSFDAALRIALNIFNHTCELSSGSRLPRIAPIRLMDSGGADGTIMSTRAYLALTHWNGRMAWVPTSLLRQRLTEAQLRELDETIDHDIEIVVNNDIDFAISDSECAFAAQGSKHSDHFSAITTLLHELLHGIGVMSIGIDPTFLRNDTHLNTIGTPWDNLLRDELGQTFVPVNQSSVGVKVAGTPLWINDVRVYNPMKWESGSSLSHFDPTTGDFAIMEPFISPGKCLFKIPSHLATTLISMGWQCHNITTHPDYTWDHGVLSIQQADSSTIPTMGIIFALLIFGTLALLSWWRDTQYFQFPQPDLVTPRPLQVYTPFMQTDNNKSDRQ